MHFIKHILQADKMMNVGEVGIWQTWVCCRVWGSDCWKWASWEAVRPRRGRVIDWKPVHDVHGCCWAV